ncbi:uncharacterized protein LOC112513518 [Cynara cardunculus var. scolymus]|uniref:DUF7866 domain-containing protein n=1 Tax=Cynara cardunculus var. scolymus TaxID=59895 RepID=A0A103Y628_CYNCS|nr:uncharacterized protein LOC112513518 [Cynara cardunculus var. scolymus]KVI03202.1 hypothetical protein Ccrd_018496 [Cynara cardunculus var. scolymus]
MVHMGSCSKHASSILFLLMLILFINYKHSDGAGGDELEKSSSKIGELVPIGVGRSEFRLEMDYKQRRKLGPFQVCLGCKCCVVATDPTTCSNMPCCFGIDCQLPNKPFGVCAFVPKTCNCTTCS